MMIDDDKLMNSSQNICDNLIKEANELLFAGDFDYAFCGGFGIELFLNRTIRKHGDIDVSAYWRDRDNIILFMQSLGWNVYEMCGGGIAHHIYDVNNLNKRFCCNLRSERLLRHS